MSQEKRREMIKLEKSIAVHLDIVRINLAKIECLLKLYIELRSAPHEKKAVIPKHT